MSTAADNTLRTADGVPLKTSLRRAMARRRVRTFLLVVPILAFLMITFVFPVIDMLFRSVDNQIVSSVLPRTTLAIQSWDPASEELPPEFVYEALVLDIQESFKDKTLGRAGRRLNYEQSGIMSLFRKSGRRAKRITEAPFQGPGLGDRPALGGADNLAIDLSGIEQGNRKLLLVCRRPAG